MKYYLFFALNFVLFISNNYAQEHYTNEQIDSLFQDINLRKLNENEKYFELLKNIYISSSYNEYPIGKAFSLTHMGIYESTRGNYLKAIKDIEKSNQIAEKLKNDSLIVFNSFVMAIQYGRLGINDKSIDLIDFCIEKANVIKGEKFRNFFLGQVYSNKSHFSVGLTPTLRTREYLINHRKAFKYFDKIKKTVYNQAYTNIGHTYLEIKQYDSAVYYFKKSAQDRSRFMYAKKEIDYINLAEVYYQIKNYELALKYLDSSSFISKQKRIYYLLVKKYNLYGKVYEAKNDNKNTLFFHKLELTYKDSLTTFDSQNIKLATNYVLKKSEIELENKNNRIFKIKALLISLLFILLLLLYYYYYLRKKFDNTNQKNIQDLKVKKDEIIDLKHKIIDSYEEVLEMARKNDPLFLNFFKELYPDFYNALLAVNPNLTLTEQKVCFYIKLKFSTKEIANATFVGVKAIQNRKNRLRKRLFIEKGSDLYEWFEKL